MNAEAPSAPKVCERYSTLTRTHSKPEALLGPQVNAERRRYHVNLNATCKWRAVVPNG